MDGWQSLTGEHIRNYMWVTETLTFFFHATNAGVIRPTEVNIGAEAIKMIEATGAKNVVSVTNDNASDETTSWDYMQDKYCSARDAGLPLRLDSVSELDKEHG